MTRSQIYVLIGAAICFAIFYFGFDNKPKDLAEVEEKRALNAASTDIRVLLKEAKATLSPGQLARVQSFEQAVESSTQQQDKVQNLKLLSGAWFELERADIAGFYAAQLAETLQDETSWSIAGTTYAIGLQRASEEKVKAFCMENAVAAFENAISINPENLDHQVNLAVCYADFPPQDNPMKGIMMLMDLNKKDPDNVSVLTNLGRLGIKTGQFEKAIGRLEKVVTLNPDYIKAYCLLAEAYEGAGKKAEAEEAASKCKKAAPNN
jgi:tetratricopeptide (TPR) repeat protein